MSGFGQFLECAFNHADKDGQVGDQPQVGIEAPANPSVVADERDAQPYVGEQRNLGIHALHLCPENEEWELAVRARS